LITGIITTLVGAMLWRTLVGTPQATTIIRQISGMNSTLDPTTDTRIEVPFLAGNGTARDTSRTGTVSRGTKLRATKGVAGRIIGEEGTANGVQCTAGIAKMVRGRAFDFVVK
jgi:hypothetical protein